jgi:flavin-dependent dehydrogenase
MAPVESLEEAHFALPKALDRVALHPAFENLLRGAERGERAGSTRLAGGRRHFRSFFGDGWMILGSAAGLYDPRHPYEIRVELTSGKCAAEAVLHALAVRDYSRTTLGLYKRMLLDSYVMADIEGAASENERRRRQPDLDGYYPGLMVRRLTLELGAGITPRGEARDALEAEAARERPMWEQIKAGLGGVRLV